MIPRFFAVTLSTAILSLASPALAADIQGVATFYPDDPGWRVNFADAALGCDPQDFMNAVVGAEGTITLDGVTSNFVMWGGGYGTGNDLLMNFGNVANGTLTALTLEGASAIDCGSHRLLLPGYGVAPPPAPIPTLSEWAMILLAGLLAAGAAFTLRRRRQTV